MKYLISEENRQKTLKNYQKRMFIQYAFGVAIFAGMVVMRRQYSNPTFLVAFIIVLFASVGGWYMFSKIMKNNLSTEYKISDGNLRIYKNDKLVNNIPLLSILRISKTSIGHQLHTSRGEVFISDLVENKQELLNTINPVPLY